MHASLDPLGPSHRLPAFFLLVFAFSVPFWLIGGVTDLQLMPGLSVSVLLGFCPMVAALILVYRNQGGEGAWALLKRSFDFKRIKPRRWLVPVLVLMPAVSLVVYGLMRWLHMPLPAAQFQLFLALLMMGRSPIWIAWWCLYAMTFRIFTVWLYNNTGKSVFAATLFHATLNHTYMLFPVNGSHFDMQLASLVMAGAALVVVLVWGPKTLAGRTNA